MMLLGQLAALTTSVLFSATSTFFTLAGRAVTPIVVNRIRLLVAVFFLFLAHFIFQIPYPQAIQTQQVFWLGLSGIIGLVLGDIFLFQAFVWIGPRLSMLMMSLAPVFGALLGRVFLNEVLTTGQILGMMLTLAGIAWVVLKGRAKNSPGNFPKQQYVLGILFGLGAALGQAGGLITAKLGLGEDLSALTGTLIRMIAAAITLWFITMLQHQGRASFQKIREQPTAILFILLGAFFGPTLGVTLSLYAVQQIPVGIASTLTALPPIFLLPISYFVFKERFSWHAVAGTALAIFGVAVLFLV
jgi:drug/metabolite transporter (DMT)-like permease